MSFFSRVRSLTSGITVLSSRFYWPIVCAVLLVVAGVNLRSRQNLVAQANASRESKNAALSTVIREHDEIARLVGIKLRWPEGLKPISRVKAFNTPIPGYRVIAILNGSECNVPRNRLVQLLVRLQFSASGSFDPNSSVMAIIGSTQPQIAESFRVGNKLEFPVVLDATEAFVKANGIAESAIIMVADAQDRVIMASTPIGGESALWSTFERRLLVLLNARHEDTQ